jgi:hypothetical protein
MWRGKSYAKFVQKLHHEAFIVSWPFITANCGVTGLFRAALPHVGRRIDGEFIGPHCRFIWGEDRHTPH